MHTNALFRVLILALCPLIASVRAETLFVAQQAYLKASNAEAGDYFGDVSSVAIAGDIAVIGAPFESSNSTGVNGDQENNDAFNSGAAYVFVRHGKDWVQEAYLKASNTEAGDYFGSAVAISGDTIVIGAQGEDGDSKGIGGDQSNNFATDSGAAYVFVREGTNWIQQAYLKASNTGTDDFFGATVAISGDTIVIGAEGEDSLASGVNGNQNDNPARETERAGAAYVFVRENRKWRQQAYLKASNPDAGDDFGGKVAIDKDTIVVASDGEDSAASGINGDQTDNSATDTGAVYVFARNGNAWTQEAYLKASNPTDESDFGEGLSIFGNTIVVGAPREENNGSGINRPGPNNNGAPGSGAAYVFVKDGAAWSQQAYLKASNAGAGDYFGRRVGIWQDTVIVGAGREDSSSTGVNHSQNNDGEEDSGAAYVFVRSGKSWTQQAYLKAVNTEAGDNFGAAVAIWDDTVIAGAYDESSDARGVNGNSASNDAESSGAAYVFTGVGPAVAPVSTSARIVISWPQTNQIFNPLTSARLDRPWLDRFEGSLSSANGRQELTIKPTAASQFFCFGGEGYYYDDAFALPPPIANDTGRLRGPSLSSDGLSLYFSTDAPGHADLWCATRNAPNEPWGAPVNLKDINTDAEEAFPVISGDGLSLYFSDWFLYFRGDNSRPKSQGGGDIWVAWRTNLHSKWQAPYNPAAINTGFLETMPGISKDGLTLIFTSNRPGNLPGSGTDFEGTDLWMSTRTDAADTNGWTFPVNLGPNVNSIYSDSAPFLTPDGLALYFTSDRPSPDEHNGYQNIWVSRRKSLSEPFGIAESLGQHFTDFFHLADACLAPDGHTLFFASRGRLGHLSPLAGLWQVSLRPYPPLSITVVRSIEP